MNTMIDVKSWDAIVVGGGIIGMSLALSLRRHGAEVLVLDRNQPGREASHAAGGMLADCETPEAIKDFAIASALLYPAFVDILQDESGIKIDFRRNGTIHFADEGELAQLCRGGSLLTSDQTMQIEPKISYTGSAVLLKENSVDPRSLMTACIGAAKHLEVDISSAAPALKLELSQDRVAGVRSDKTTYRASVVVNCAGAWAGSFGPIHLPVNPVKGHMVCVVPENHGGAKVDRHLIEHVVRTPEIYLVPRSDGRIVFGSTKEYVGFNKRVVPATVQNLHQKAAYVVPEIGEYRILESWTGLRPGTPDKLPILGRTEIEGYFIATGHYRDGILLAPETALQMSKIIRGQEPDIDLSRFDVQRFGSVVNSNN